ncbi:zinc finger, CCHC-type containing protein [Tanacetum coccineum]
MWCLCDSTPSGWCKTDALSTEFASNWLERLPVGSISTWEDLTTRFLAQFFPSRRTAKLRNDILMFQQHQGESLSEAWTRFKDLLQKIPHHGIDHWLQIHIFYDHVSFHIKCEIDRAAGGKLHDKNTEESWEIIENLALYDHEGRNDSRDFVKLIKADSTSQHTPKEWRGSNMLSSNSEKRSTTEWQNCLDFLRNSRVEEEKNVEGNEVVNEKDMECHTPKWGLDGIRVQGRCLMSVSMEDVYWTGGSVVRCCEDVSVGDGGDGSGGGDDGRM